MTGTGEPIIFLHTGLQTGKAELDLQREYFNQNYQVILPDLRGHGKSISDDFSDYFNRSACDLAETLDALDLRSAHIVGCSLGALVGLVFAKQYSNMVSSLTLSGIMPEKPSDWEKINQNETEQIEQVLKNPDTFNYFDTIHKGNWQALLKITQDPDWYPFNTTSDLSMIHCPTLFIIGEQNVNETIGAIKYPEMNPKIHTAVIPFAGHTVHLDRPEIYNEILEIFLNGFALNNED
ncbi:alpha/beta hydrolase [Salinicoccus jeotgali]|uniref:Alpha/beta hydrolase n=1 Tax=Salinicoccus jeotgali TaxID=381634 RepID=A0ABP7ECE3_9STAP